MSNAPRKRERENPCWICGHYHKYEQGEVCGECGHRMPASSDRPAPQGGAFPTTILTDFLYLGAYENASRPEMIKAQAITHILNTVPACQNLYKNTFTYHCLEGDKNFHFDDAIQFLEQCEKDKVRVLVHCMSGKSRSPAIVMAYLMKCRGWRLAQSFQWVKERRPQVELSEAATQQLKEYEHKIFGSSEPVPVPAPAFPSSDSLPSFGFGSPKTTDAAPHPVFNQSTITSVFERMGPNAAPGDFVFGAGRTTEQNISYITDNIASGMIPPDSNEAAMDSS